MSSQIDVRAYASAVVSALTDLQGYLSKSITPDRMALADLGMEQMGWTTRVYSTKAFEIWRKQLELFCDDPLTLHHMAIMHHARAFDLESGERPSESDADWMAAMRYWHRLHGMDAFWDKLTAKACAGTTRPEVVKKLRADLPQLILGIHYDIALDPQTRELRKSRAKFHISMVHKAPFDAQIRTEAQRAAYGRYIKSVPDEVWQPNELREEVLEKGQKAIIEYVNFDPECVCALEDALRLQRRVQRSRNTTWQALDKSDPRRKALLLLEKKDAEAWRPFFDQLINKVEELEEDVREDLSRWYSGRGGDLCALDLDEQAIDFYERAVRVCRPDSDLQRECRRGLSRTWAYAAREKAGRGEIGATAYCHKVRGRDDLTAVACYLLAQAYLHLRLFDDAASACDKGLSVEPDFDDLEADECAGQLTVLKKEIPILKLTAIATETMKAGRFDEAIPSLNQAEKLAIAGGMAHRHDSIYWLRCQANLGLDRIKEARRDLKIYKETLDEESSTANVEAVRELEAMIAAKEEMGSIKPLLDKAKQAMEAGRFKDALSPLNEAARKTPKNEIIYFLRCQAHAVLGNFAEARKDAKTVAGLAESKEDRDLSRKLDEMISEAEAATVVNGILQRARAAMEGERYSDALTLLTDAAKKAPKNDVIYFLRCQAHVALGNMAEARRDAKTVSDLAESKADREAVQRLNEMIEKAEDAMREVGGLEASKLRQQAISAFNEDRHQEAIRLMRQAVDASKRSGHRDGAPKLRVEFSQILTIAAVSLANSSQESFGRNVSASGLARLRSVMSETAQMLEEAAKLDRTNTRASENLGQVRQILNQLP